MATSSSMYTDKISVVVGTKTAALVHPDPRAFDPSVNIRTLSVYCLSESLCDMHTCSIGLSFYCIAL